MNIFCAVATSEVCELTGGTGKRGKLRENSREQKYSGQVGRFWVDTEVRWVVGVKFISEQGSAKLGRETEWIRGGASYLDRVLSAKCFCWLSACLQTNKQINKKMSQNSNKARKRSHKPAKTQS